MCFKPIDAGQHFIHVSETKIVFRVGLAGKEYLDGAGALGDLEDSIYVLEDKAGALVGRNTASPANRERIRIYSPAPKKGSYFFLIGLVGLPQLAAEKGIIFQI